MKTQKRYIRTENVGLDNDQVLEIDLRYGDECRNGHNTFSITGTLRDDQGLIAAGCIHDEIEKYAPEFKNAVKFHLCTDDGPLHYIPNTVYFAGDRDCWGRRAVDPFIVDHFLAVGDHPLVAELPSLLADKLKSLPEGEPVEATVVNVPYDGNVKTELGDHYHLTFSADDPIPRWAECYYRKEWQAQQVAKALALPGWRIEEHVVERSKGKEPELETARRVAIWPDATLEQLRDPNALKARLPALLREFADMLRSYGLTPSEELQNNIERLEADMA